MASKAGEGSTFTLTLTTGNLDGVSITDSESLDQQRQHAASPTGVSRELPPIRILVADDAPANRELLKLVLGRAGAVIGTAENGQIAVDLAASDDYDILLMDMQMPVMDGFDATRTIRQQSDVPILALTADAMQGSEERCLDAGCTGFVPKPIDLDDLFRAIKQAVGVAEEPVMPAARDPEPAMPTKPSHQLPLSRAARAERGLPEDEADYRVLLDEFRSLLQDQLDGMIQAVQRGDYECLASEAQAVKTRAVELGYEMFTDPADHLHEAAREEAELDEIRCAVGELIAQSEHLLVPTQPVTESDQASPPPQASLIEPTESKAKIRTSLPLDDPEFLRIVCGFVEHLQLQLDRMQDAWKARDLDELAGLAHWLKGAGGTLGFDVFTEPARQLQHLAQEGCEEQIESAIAGLLDLAARIEIPEQVS